MYESNTGANKQQRTDFSDFLKQCFNSTQMLLYPEIWYKKCPGLGSLGSLQLQTPHPKCMPSVHKIQGEAAVSASKDNVQVPGHSYKGVSGVQAPPELGNGMHRF